MGRAARKGKKENGRENGDKALANGERKEGAREGRRETGENELRYILSRCIFSTESIISMCDRCLPNILNIH